MSTVLLATFAVAFTVYIIMEKKTVDTLDKLANAVAANTVAVEAAIEKLSNIPAPGIDETAVINAIGIIEANNADLLATLNAPVVTVPEPVPPVELVPPVETETPVEDAPAGGVTFAP